MGDEPLEEVYAPSLRSGQALIEEVLGEVRGCQGYVEDLELALRSARAGEADDKPFTLLPILCCQAVGGDGHRAIAVAAAWRLLLLAARILDDLEDRDTDQALWAAIGPAQANNAATGLIFAASLALAHLRQGAGERRCRGAEVHGSGGAWKQRSKDEMNSTQHLCSPVPLHSSTSAQRGGVADELLLTLYEDFNRTALRICAGQHGDLAQQEVSLEEYWEIVAAKAGEPLALACRAGALVGGGNPQQVALLGEFGHNLGLLTQIGDDFHGVWDPCDRSDLAMGRRTLPVLYALDVAPPALQDHLQELLARATSKAKAEVQARQMITDLGAPQYLLVEGELRRQQAKAALQAVGPPSPALSQLAVLLDRASPWGEGRDNHFKSFREPFLLTATASSPPPRRTHGHRPGRAG